MKTHIIIIGIGLMAMVSLDATSAYALTLPLGGDQITHKNNKKIQIRAKS